MTYGAPYGSEYYGQPGPLPDAMLSRLLMFVRAGPRFVGIVNALATRTERMIAACIAIREAFDLDTAEGVQLDRIGGIVQLPRFGYSDARYRALLRVQIDILLSSTSGAETLLRVFEAITGSPAAEYLEHYPAQFMIGGYVDPADVSTVRDFLRRAKGWGIYGGLAVYPAEESDLVEGTLLGDVIGSGEWSVLSEGKVFHPPLSTLLDPHTGVQGVAIADATYDAGEDAYVFDGTGDYLSFSPFVDITPGFTISAWINLDSFISTNNRIATTMWFGTSASAGLMVTNAGRLQLIRATQSGTTMVRASANATIATGQWYHVVATSPAGGFLDASLNRLFVGGREVSSYAATTNGIGTERTTTDSILIGGLNSAGAFLDGMIHDVRVYDRVLSRSEIWHLFEEGRGAYDVAPPVDNPGVGDTLPAAGPDALAYATATMVGV